MHAGLGTCYHVDDQVSTETHVSVYTQTNNKLQPKSHAPRTATKTTSVSEHYQPQQKCFVARMVQTVSFAETIGLSHIFKANL